MLDSVATVVQAPWVKSWRRILWGLWFSGLRLGEALRLSWDSESSITVVDIDAKRPKLRFRSDGQKSGKDELVAVTPDFAALLRKTPKERRRGLVFRPRLSKGRIKCIDTASHTISAIGKAANVVVEKVADDVKYASAHDLRRSFGARWAPRLMPIILKELMRHASIETTLKYYVGLDAERTAAEIWRAFGDPNGDQQRTSKDAKTHNS